MECGIVGLPTAGKTTILGALTGNDPAGYPGGGQSPNVGIANIPDPRLQTIATHIPTEKIVPATIHFVDIPGVPAGSDAARLNKFLEHVRQVDALCEVVRVHDATGTPPDPAADMRAMSDELILADLAVAEPALDRATRAARAADAEAKARVATLEQVIALLSDEQPLRSKKDWSDQERLIIRGFGMMTAKPLLYVANVAEDDVDGSSDGARIVADHAVAIGAQSVVLCGQLESELAQIEESDRGELLESLGLAEPAIGVLARAVNALLGLSVFYTAGPKEVRAWTIEQGSSAPKAAGTIHSDMERGFIRAECYTVNDLVEHRTEKAIKEAGRLRSEGKAYQMQDGDVVHVLFNV